MKVVLFIVLFCASTFSALAQTNKIRRRLIWSDEFNYSGLPDAKKWNYEEGFVRNKEPQYYTKQRLENAHVENGSLIIETRKEAYKDANYTSASLITLGKMHLKYGRIEVRANVCKGIGGWPAIWMLGIERGRVKWPNCGEIDILEYVGKDSTQIYGTVHYADSTNSYPYYGEKPVVGKPYGDFHVYSMDWDKGEIAFYYDNLRYFVFDLKKADNLRRNPLRKNFNLLLNLALGTEGSLGGALDDNILPLKYEIDYVRIFK